MISVEIVIWVYNLSLCLVVTPIDAKFRRFKVETINSTQNAMIVKYSPGHSWVAEKATMKFFTKKHIRKLGKLIKIERPEWFGPKASIQ